MEAQHALSCSKRMYLNFPLIEKLDVNTKRQYLLHFMRSYMHADFFSGREKKRQNKKGKEKGKEERKRNKQGNK